MIDNKKIMRREDYLRLQGRRAKLTIGQGRMEEGRGRGQISLVRWGGGVVKYDERI
jgi:hypothetical protein